MTRVDGLNEEVGEPGLVVLFVDQLGRRFSLMLDVDQRDVGDLEVVVTPPGRVAGLLAALQESVAAADEATVPR